METERICKFKWFWPWQDEQEEAWLAAMSEAGWHFGGMAGPAMYSFARGEPTRYVYRLDWQDKSKQQLSDYRQLFQDAGWELVTEYSGWHYFRKVAVPGQTADIFTDVQSKIAKYERQFAFMSMMSVIFLPIIVATMDSVASPFAKVAIFVMLLLLVVEVGIAAGLWLRIHQLKRLGAISA
jgi:hypothetical protein